jgi:hypothetical protein
MQGQEGTVRRTIACLTAIGSLSLVTLGLVPAAAPASPPSASIKFVNQATLQENGTVLISLMYRCSPEADGGTFGIVEARLSQGEGEAFGREAQAAECNGEKHKVTVDIFPQLGSFSPGPATAFAEVHNIEFSSHAETSEVLKVK